MVVGGLAAGWASSIYWQGHRERLISATFTLNQTTLPRNWQGASKAQQVQFLTIKVKKASSKRAQLENVTIDGVHEIDAVTLALPESVSSVQPTWAFKLHKSGLYGNVQISNLPALPAGYANLELYVWGTFTEPGTLEVVLYSDEAKLPVALIQTDTNQLWFADTLFGVALILLSTFFGAALAYIREKKQ